ncbi:hypothetical protein J1614_012205 [Plenodomus biglobosus]|nr:hypothetical protein J1614_012205 [Plenodomus biglobosus]
MSGFGRTVFLGSVATRLHQEPAGRIKSSADLNFTANADFPVLFPLPATSIAGSASALLTAFDKIPCFGSSAGRAAGVQLNRNGSVHVGSAGDMCEVWASLITGPADLVACDSPGRAFVVLEAVSDRRDDPAHGDVDIRGLGSTGRRPHVERVHPRGHRQGQVCLCLRHLGCGGAVGR